MALASGFIGDGLGEPCDSRDGTRISTANVLVNPANPNALSFLSISSAVYKASMLEGLSQIYYGTGASTPTSSIQISR